MKNYQRERERQVEKVVPVVGAFTLFIMCIVLFNSSLASPAPCLVISILSILIYLLVLGLGRSWQGFLSAAGGTSTKQGWYNYVILLTGIGLVALVVYMTGGAYSSYKNLFLPVILVFSLRHGLTWGMVACSLAGAAIFSFAWLAEPGWLQNPYLEADLVTTGIFFLATWLVAKTYQELMRSFAIRERSVRLAALGKMVANTAHEIRNPLTTLRGCLQIMQYSLRNRDPAWYSGQAETFRIMLAEIDRMNTIISDLLLFARPLPPRKQLVNLNQIAREMGLLLDCRARLHGIEIQVRQCRNGRPVEVDPDQLKQVIHNIVGNALEVMSSGGVVQIAVQEKGGQMQLEIRDNGPGIPPEELPHIFEPFYTSGKKGGAGLGLAISHRLVEGNGGRLSVGSELGRGTVFTVQFPIAEAGAGKEGANSLKEPLTMV
jgi:signal transduction histidine kinase